MLRPENQPKKYDLLFADIDFGRIKIPSFQRDFVWTREQTAQLIDSIIKGFPIGTFIFWKTREYLRHVRDIGDIELPEPPAGEPIQYVLDGQQRITSLYAARKGARMTKEGRELDYRGISINLDLPVDTEEVVVMVEPAEGITSITVYELLNSGVARLAATYSGAYLEKIEHYRTLLTTYDFSTVVISDYPLDIACEVFTRINTGGTQLTLFEIMVAKTYKDGVFDLAERYQLLLDSKNNGKDLDDANFDTLSPSVVLQCVSACMAHQIRRQDILKLGRDEFIAAWPQVVDAIFLAVDYIRSTLRIPVSTLLPYQALVVPFTYFFYYQQQRATTALQDQLLVQFFWWASLGKRYSSGFENKVAQDLDRMDDILAHKPPSYRGEEVRLTFESLQFHWFSTADAFCKALLCLYAGFEPKSFNSNAVVRIDNSWLKQINSRNYHHFFPRAYLRNRGLPEWQANCILNITIVDDRLNKQKIRANAPATYMEGFKKSNRHLEATMRTHLIDDLETFGIWANDYDAFLRERGRRVLEELQKRLEPDLIVEE